MSDNVRVWIRALLVLCVTTALSTEAHAQVFKCKNPNTGQITFSDSACPSESRLVEVKSKQTAEEIAADYQRAIEARKRNADQEQSIRSAIAQPDESPTPPTSHSTGTESSQECAAAKRNLNMHPSKDNRYATNLACLGAETTGKIEAAKAGAPKTSMRCVPDGFGNFNCH